MRIVVGQQVRCADRFHFFAWTGLGRTQTSQLAEGFQIDVIRNDDASGSQFQFLFFDLRCRDGQGAWVHDRRGHACTHCHRQERVVDAVTVRQTERDVRCATCGVHAQLFAQTTDESEYLVTSGRHCTDRHNERVNNDVVGRDAKVSSALNDFLCHFETNVWVFGDTSVVVRDRNNRNVVFLNQRQNEFQTLFFARDRVQKRATFGSLQTRFESSRNRGVDADRAIGQALNQFDHFDHERRLGLVRVRVGVIHNASVDIEDVRTSSNLCQCVLFNGREIACFQFSSQFLAARRVDPFTNHAERLVKADNGGFRCGFDDSAGHTDCP